MNIHHATKWILTLTLLLTTYSCSPANPVVPTSTSVPPTSTLEQPLTPTPPIDPATATQVSLACLTQPGRVDEGKLESTNPAQEYLIYLPPCYDENTDERYPVLYLLHGQTYTKDQWIRLGVVDVINDLILAGESMPFIIVFPDDRYWNLPPGPGFGQRLVENLIPYIDQNYRTIDDREYRAIGGMSRGAGWALRLGLTHWQLFGSIGLHSLAVLQKDASKIEDWLADIPASSQPRVFMDIGDNDPELTMASQVETQFNEQGLSHEWHLYKGTHTEEYWAAHVEEYIQWYVDEWNTP